MTTKEFNSLRLRGFKTINNENEAGDIKIPKMKNTKNFGNKRVFGDITNKEKNILKLKVKPNFTTNVIKNEVNEGRKDLLLPKFESLMVANKNNVGVKKLEPKANPTKGIRRRLEPTFNLDLRRPKGKVYIDEKRGIVDVDAKDRGDPLKGGPYTHKIFEYLKSREAKFIVHDYLNWQPELNKIMRAVLVDWMVEVQENFELNHETLYMAVKLMDLYLDRSFPRIEILDALLSANRIARHVLIALFVHQEVTPPLLDDFKYICDEAYTRDQLLEMEIKLLKNLDFDIGVPLSYSFLRRYAKCGGYNMKCLTLARYLLESSLLDYYFIDQSDSKMAAASLLLATKMIGIEKWDATMVYYTGWNADQLNALVVKLNAMNSKPTYKNSVAVRTKYEHELVKVIEMYSQCIRGGFRRN